MTIGERLRELRKARGLDQGTVARDLNVSRSCISRYERGIRQPSSEMLQMFAEYYGVSMDYLYGKKPLCESALSDRELNLLKSFRKAPKYIQNNIIDFLNHKMSKREALQW